MVGTFPPTDHGKLTAAVEDARARLTAAGMPADTKLRAAADSGFLADEDQKFIIDNRESIDIIVPLPAEGVRRNGDVEMFKRSEFERNDDGNMVCPAGTEMTKVDKRKQSRIEDWKGVGCPECSLKQRCTNAATRSFRVDHDKDDRHAALAERYAEKDALNFYKRRLATVEPVFGGVETDMKFTRASSNLPRTILFETFLTFAVYNFGRIDILRERREAAKNPPKATPRSARSKAAARAWVARKEKLRSAA